MKKFSLSILPEKLLEMWWRLLRGILEPTIVNPIIGFAYWQMWTKTTTNSWIVLLQQMRITLSPKIHILRSSNKFLFQN